jgi:hypothetical protein
MTHDAHLVFSSSVDARKAKWILESIRIEGVPLFLVEDYPNEPTKLFYRIQFTDEVAQDAQFDLNGQRFQFFDLFTAIVKRTGRHTQKGTLLSSHPLFPAQLNNHEISNKILEFFSK